VRSESWMSATSTGPKTTPESAPTITPTVPAAAPMTTAMTRPNRLPARIALRTGCASVRSCRDLIFGVRPKNQSPTECSLIPADHGRLLLDMRELSAHTKERIMPALWRDIASGWSSIWRSPNPIRESGSRGREEVRRCRSFR
jgi:hypothetical protein